MVYHTHSVYVCATAIRGCPYRWHCESSLLCASELVQRKQLQAYSTLHINGRSILQKLYTVEKVYKIKKNNKKKPVSQTRGVKI